MKPFIFFITVIFTLTLLSACQSHSSQKKIGIILPIEHTALNEIVHGFTATLKSRYSQPIYFKIVNAQGDINLQRSLLTQMKDQQFDLLVPVATGPTEMALSLVKQTPIVGLAADFAEKDRPHDNRYVIVHDEIPVKQQLAFLHVLYPQLKKLVLVHSPSDKIFPQVKIAVFEGKRYGIHIKPIMINALNELYSVSQSLPADTQGIFVLKDNLIASGISTLTKLTHDRAILLFTSDQGSVENGAGLALGVPEKEIGRQGALLALAILQGKSIRELANVNMDNLTVFVNHTIYPPESDFFKTLQVIAKKNNYTVQRV